jgi:hypothetical protein
MEEETKAIDYRVDRVLNFFSSRRNWDSPTPSPAGECAPPLHPLVPGGEHSLAGDGFGRVPIPTFTQIVFLAKSCIDPVISMRKYGMPMNDLREDLT